MHNRIIALEGELSEARQRIAEAINAKAESNTADSEELEKANSMIAALKKQRQELISQTATLRSQNKSYENQIASLESKLNNLQAGKGNDADDFDGSTDIDDALNWMMPILPDTLEEEARRREEEERIRREEEERERQAEKERRAAQDNSAQMSLW